MLRSARLELRPDQRSGRIGDAALAAPDCGPFYARARMLAGADREAQAAAAVVPDARYVP